MASTDMIDVVDDEARFRAFVTASSDVVYRMSPDWSQMRRLEGRAFLADTDAPDASWLDRYIHPDDQATVHAAIAQAIRDKAVFELEHRVIRADGSLGWTHSRAVPLLDAAGEIREWVGAARDVTATREAADARAEAEARLRESEALRRIAFAAGRMGSWRWDLTRRQVWGDEVFLALWGFPPTDDPIPLARFTERQSAAGVVQTDGVVAQAIDTGEDFDAAVEIASGPTAGRWLRWRGRPSDEDPAVLYGVTFEITEQRQAETRLRESEQQLRAVLDQAPMAVVFTGPTGDILFRNSMFDELWGRRPHDTTARTYSDVYEGHYPDGRPVPSEAWPGARAVLKGETVHGEVLEIVNVQGRRVPCSFDAGPIHDEEGRVIGGVVLFRDVTAEIAAERALRGSEQRQRALVERQRVLLHELQHRVRNTLAVVRSMASSTGRTSDSVEDFAAHLEGRLNALARTQMVLTRAPGEGVDLQDLVREELLAQAAREERLEIDGPDVQLSAKATEVLSLAVHELATNAVKYGALGAEGRVSVRWSTSEREGRTWLHMTWQESGVRLLSGGPRRAGFGAELIEMRVPYELEGRGELQFLPGGVRCEIEFPLAPGESILQTDAPPEGAQERHV